MMAKRTTSQLWAIRAGAAVAAGLLVGVGGGLVGLKILVGDTPPPALREMEPEPEVARPRRQISGPRADGMRAGSSGEGMIGGGSLAMRDSLAVVPDLVGRVEGDARRLLERSGFAVGEIMFREDDLPAGTVLQTFPVPGERVALPATVNLILADRRRRLNPDSVFYIPDTATVAEPSALDTLGVPRDPAPSAIDPRFATPDSAESARPDSTPSAP